MITQLLDYSFLKSKKKKKKFNININNMGVNIDKNEYYEIIKSNSAFPEKGLK